MPWDVGIDPQSETYLIAASSAVRMRVLAGPGTGKSFAMKRRVARLLESGVGPSKILAMTFTRVAAEDMHRELTALNVPGCDDLEGRTLHSLALSILSRAHVIVNIGRTPKPMNRFEEAALVCDLADDHGGKNRVKKLKEAYLAAWARAQGQAPQFTPGTPEAAFAHAIRDWLIFHRSMLIGEVVPFLLKYLVGNPAAAERSLFDHVLVDEYQDLNQAEQSIIDLLSGTASLAVVGDDDQSIYSFKHAMPEGIREWCVVNVGADDRVLNECHRCPTRVVSMANSLIAHNTNRRPRSLVAMPAKGPGEVFNIQFPTLDQEARWIAGRVAALLRQGVTPGEIIVLVQRKVMAAVLKEALRAAGVPCISYYDESQLDTEAAQECFAYFKLAVDPDDRAALRFLLGMNSQSMRARPYARLREHCEMTGLSPWAALVDLEAGRTRLLHTGPLVDRFREIKVRLDALAPSLNDLTALVDDLFPTGNADVSEIREVALQTMEGVETAIDLLREMMKTITQPEIPPTVDEVRVMSLYKSKGLSSPYVFIAGCVNGLLPSLPDPQATPQANREKEEEERRLFYVGITRVKADLAQGRPGTLYLTHSRGMTAAMARRAGIDAASFSYGEANLHASAFLSELGPDAPTPVSGTHMPTD